MNRRLWLLGMALAALGAVESAAENSVVIQSKSIPAGASNVTAGIYLTNDFTLAAVCIPLEIRTVTGGAFIAGSFTATTQGRLAIYDGGNGITVKRHLGQRTNYPGHHACDVDSLGHVWNPKDSVPDFISPDAFLYAVIGVADTFVYAGSDGTPGAGTPSVLLTFGVGNQAGTFEVDTTCIAPANTLGFFHLEGFSQMEYPAFTKGVFQVGCACSCHGDPVCDSVHTVLDLSKTIGVAFRGDPPVIDPNPLCPYTDTDVNCDGVTSVIDVAKMRNVVFMGANPNTEFCHPCP